MNAAEIKRLRTESALKEILPEAFASLDDTMLKGLCVTDVDCKKGRYDAFVYLDKMALDEHEQEYVLTHLKKVSKILQNYCVCEFGWFRAPNFHFKFDDSLEHQNRMDELFSKVEKELKND